MTHFLFLVKLILLAERKKSIGYTMKGVKVKKKIDFYRKREYYTDGILKTTWNIFVKQIKEESATKEDIELLFLESTGRALEEKDIVHIYRRLLQDKYNFKGERVATVGEIVFCDDLEYGIGTVKEILDDFMLVQFRGKDLLVMCSIKDMTTVHDNIKRKITLKG